jgi:phosphoribosylanthranilate isomerase
MRTRIKFCGLTRPDDVDRAVDLGVDALGFVVVPGSRRRLDPAHAETLIARVPAFVSVVALFADAGRSQIQALLARMRVDLLQFHGNEANMDCIGHGKPFVKALAMGDDAAIARSRAYPDALALLLDGHAAGEMGGQGRAFDWARAQDLSGQRLILAGGLDSANVAAAIARVRPFAVDVSSGIESAPGVKARLRMEQFVKEVERADRQRGK